MNAYEAPNVSELGSLADLTQGSPAPGNKVGHHPDMYSSVVPIVGSIVAQP